MQVLRHLERKLSGYGECAGERALTKGSIAEVLFIDLVPTGTCSMKSTSRMEGSKGTASWAWRRVASRHAATQHSVDLQREHHARNHQHRIQKMKQNWCVWHRPEPVGAAVRGETTRATTGPRAERWLNPRFWFPGWLSSRQPIREGHIFRSTTGLRRWRDFPANGFPQQTFGDPAGVRRVQSLCAGELKGFRRDQTCQNRE